jgi:fatty-acyl-CoA synthase
VCTCRVTSCYGTPTMYVDILAAARRAAEEGGTRKVVPSLMTGLMAGAPCPPELVQAVITELGMKDFMVGYRVGVAVPGDGCVLSAIGQFGQ